MAMRNQAGLYPHYAGYGRGLKDGSLLWNTMGGTGRFVADFSG